MARAATRCRTFSPSAGCLRDLAFLAGTVAPSRARAPRLARDSRERSWLHGADDRGGPPGDGRHSPDPHPAPARPEDAAHPAGTSGRRRTRGASGTRPTSARGGGFGTCGSAAPSGPTARAARRGAAPDFTRPGDAPGRAGGSARCQEQRVGTLLHRTRGRWPHAFLGRAARIGTARQDAHLRPRPGPSARPPSVSNTRAMSSGAPDGPAARRPGFRPR